MAVWMQPCPSRLRSRGIGSSALVLLFIFIVAGRRYMDALRPLRPLNKQQLLSSSSWLSLPQGVTTSSILSSLSSTAVGAAVAAVFQSQSTEDDIKFMKTMILRIEVALDLDDATRFQNRTSHPAAVKEGVFAVPQSVPATAPGLFAQNIVRTLLKQHHQQQQPGSNHTTKTLRVITRGGSIPTGADQIAKHGRGILVENQVTSFLNMIFNNTGIDWQPLNLAKGGTETSLSYLTWNLRDGFPRDQVALILWEHVINDDLNLRSPPTFEKWVRVHMEKYPNAELGFLFEPTDRHGGQGTALHDNTTTFPPQSETELQYIPIIEHYGAVTPSRLFRTSLGTYMSSEPDRPFKAFYDIPGNTHYNVLAYDAQADIVIHHIKGALREAVAIMKETGGAADDVANDEKSLQLPDWINEAPSKASADYQIMNNEDYLEHTVSLYVPSPYGRDLEGVQVECCKADGTITMEDGMVHNLPKLIEEKNCSNLENVSIRGKRFGGRVDVDFKIRLPHCGRYPDESYKLFVPFSFRRIGNIIAWPPSGFTLYVNDALVNSTDPTKQAQPEFVLDSPTPAEGVYLRLCSPVEDNLVTLSKCISFT